MSRSFSVNYELEGKRRQEAYLKQVRDTTQTFLERYKNVLEDLRSQNLVSGVSQEFRKVENQLNSALALLSNDPKSARNISRELGSQVRDLASLARSRHREHIARQRVEERQQREDARLREVEETRLREEKREKMREKMESFGNQIRNLPREMMKDPVVLDLAWTALLQLQNRFLTMSFQNEADFVQAQRQFQSELASLVKNAEQQAVLWREKKKREEKNLQISEQISENLEILHSRVESESESELQVISDKLAKLKTDFLAGLVTESEVQTQIQTAQDETVEIYTGEEVRRETLRAIVKTLRDVGFILESAPQLQKDGFVCLPATRPTGEKCIFLVATDGSMKYSFHGYSGSACKKDIENVMPKLREIYGIHFSEERLLWENPDRLEKDARELPGDGAFKKRD